MKRLAVTLGLLAALLAVVPASVLAAGAGGQGARPTFGPQFIDVTAYGLTPNASDSTTATKNNAAVQAAQDALAAAGGGTLWFKSGGYTFQYPILSDKDGITWAGEGDATVLSTGPLRYHPVVISGNRLRSSNWVGTYSGNPATLPTADGHYRFDLSGTLDTSIAAGTRYGLRTYDPLSANSVQVIQLPTNPAPTGGTWTATFNGQTTAGIAYNASAATVQTALQALSTIGSGNCTVSQPFSSLEYRVQFVGARAGTAQPLMAASGSGLTGSSTTVMTWFQPDHYLRSVGQIPSTGVLDAWSTQQKLTLQIAINGPATTAVPSAGVLPVQAICGMGQTSNGHPEPWLLQTDLNSNSYTFWFMTKEGGGSLNSNSAGYLRSVSFGNTQVSGLQRLCVQVDMSVNDAIDGSGCCSVQAYQNGVQQAVTRNTGCRLTTASTTGSGEPSFTAGDNLHFDNQPVTEFNVGTFGAPNGNPGTGFLALDLCGIRISNAPIYKNLGSGQAQTRLDNGTITDFKRYFDTATDWTNTVCLLPLTDPSHDASKPSDRLVTIYGGPPSIAATSGGPYVSYCFLQPSNVANGGTTSTSNLIFRDLKLQNGGQGYGTALLSNLQWNCAMERCTLNGGWTGAYLMGGYDYFLDRLTCNGTDSWITARGILGRAARFKRAVVGRSGFRLDGCNMELSYIPFGAVRTDLPAGSCDSYVYFIGTSEVSYGYQLKIDHMDTDNEGLPGVPSKAAIYCEISLTSGFATSVYVTDIAQTQLPKGRPLIALHDQPQAFSSGLGGYVQLKNVYPQTTQYQLVKTDGPRWQGEIDLSNGVEPQIAARVHSGTDGQTNVEAIHRMTSLPTRACWVKNGDSIIITQPAAGGARKYLCTTSGFGTWSTTTAYVAGDLVWNPTDSTVYLATAGSTNSQPPSANWSAVPAWNNTTAYTADQLVTYNGSVWANVTANTGTAPASRYHSGNPWGLIGPAAQALFAPVQTLGTPTH